MSKIKGYVCDICGDRLDFWKRMLHITGRARRVRMDSHDDVYYMGKSLDLCEDCYYMVVRTVRDELRTRRQEELKEAGPVEKEPHIEEVCATCRYATLAGWNHPCSDCIRGAGKINYWLPMEETKNEE